MDKIKRMVESIVDPMSGVGEMMVDRIALMQLCAEVSERYVQEMISTYVDATKGSIQELLEAGRKRNAKEMEHASHYLKGASSLLGLVGMEKINQRVVTACREGRLDDAVETSLEIEDCFERTCRELSLIFPTLHLKR